jgi:hypothetical protein
MDSDSISDFNALKAAILIASYPVTVVFTGVPGTSYACAFGETRNDAGLHDSGQGIQQHRVGALYWPVAASHVPGYGHALTITACAARPALVGTKWRIADKAEAALEPHAKFTLTKIEE